MDNIIKRILIIFLFVLILTTGCAPSLVYSPSINLPPKPLEKDDVQILGGVGYFPETRTDRVTSKMVLGGEATIRYAFSNSYSMQIEGWYDFSDQFDFSRWGFSFAGIIVLNDSSNYKFGLMPNIAAVLGDNSFEGGGGYLPVILWINHLDPINFYAGIGPALGFRDLTTEKSEWGWGIFLNTGLGILIDKKLTMNLEFAFIKQFNKYNNLNDNFFSPSLNIGYIF